MPTTFISTDQGNTERTFAGHASDVFNCTGGIFHVVKPNPNYPLAFDTSPHPQVEAFGGVTLGSLSPFVHRNKPDGLYGSWNSGSVRAVRSGLHLHHWTWGYPEYTPADDADWVAGDTSQVWDAINIEQSTGKDILIEDCICYSGVRDDMVEWDVSVGAGGWTGSLTIRRCLFDWCYAGISATGHQDGRLITIDQMLLKITNNYPRANINDFTSGPMLKVDGSLPLANRPRWVSSNSVYAYDGTPQEVNRLIGAFQRMTCTNDHLLFLGANRPSNIPLSAIPAGMTVLEGSAATNFWNTARANFLGQQGGTGTTRKRRASCNRNTGVITLDRTSAWTGTAEAVVSNSAGEDRQDFTVTVS